MKLAAIVPAIGDGRRQKAGRSWPFQDLGGRPVLARTLECLERCDRVHVVYPLVRAQDLTRVQRDIVDPGGFSKVGEILVGGLLRQDYLYKALMQVGPGCDLIMIHDGNRPLVGRDLLDRTIVAAEVHGAAVAAVPVHDTVKVLSKDNFIKSSLDRRRLRAIQTPEVFRFDILMRAFEAAARENFYGSDEAVLVERLGERIKVVAGSRLNIYVASREDLNLARAILESMK